MFLFQAHNCTQLCASVRNHARKCSASIATLRPCCAQPCATQAKPPHPWCRGATEGLGAQGQVSAPSALPWPRRGLPKRPVGTSAAPEPRGAPSPLSSSPPPPPSAQTACAGAHLPPLAQIEGAPRGAWSSNAAPPGAPYMSCTRGPCARRIGSAWGVAAPPSSLRHAAPAAACAAVGHCRPAPVALHRPAPVPPRPRRAYYQQGQGPIKVLDAVRRVRRGGYGSGAGVTVPPPPPAHPLVSRRDGRTGRPQARAKWVRSRVFYKKKRVFFCCFFCRFWPFLAAGWCFFMFFGVFLFFHGGIRYKRILWYQGSIVF